MGKKPVIGQGVSRVGVPPGQGQPLPSPSDSLLQQVAKLRPAAITIIVNPMTNGIEVMQTGMADNDMLKRVLITVLQGVEKSENDLKAAAAKAEIDAKIVDMKGTV